jgi:hypothetical protein
LLRPASRRPLPRARTSPPPDHGRLPAMTCELAKSLKIFGQTLSQTPVALPVSPVNVKFSPFHSHVLRGLVTT